MKDSIKPPPHLDVAIPSDPDEVYLSGFAEGIRRGLAMAGDPCAQGIRCPTPAPVASGPLAGDTPAHQPPTRPPTAPAPLSGAMDDRQPQPPLAGTNPDDE